MVVGRAEPCAQVTTEGGSSRPPPHCPRWSTAAGSPVHMQDISEAPCALDGSEYVIPEGHSLTGTAL